MDLYFSPGAGGFYLAGVHADKPADAVPVTADRHRELMDAQVAGARIEAGPDGQPVAVMPDPLTADQRLARVVVRVKGEAAQRIEAFAPPWRQLNDLREPTDAGAARFARIDAIRAASDLIEALAAETPAAGLDAFPVSDHPLWPVFEAEAPTS